LPGAAKDVEEPQACYFENRIKELLEKKEPDVE